RGYRRIDTRYRYTHALRLLPVYFQFVIRRIGVKKRIRHADFRTLIDRCDEVCHSGFKLLNIDGLQILNKQRETSCRAQTWNSWWRHRDRKSTRLNSSHVKISYA